MKKCDNCGENVSNDFHRVFSDNNGNLYACTSCWSSTTISREIERKTNEA